MENTTIVARDGSRFELDLAKVAPRDEAERTHAVELAAQFVSEDPATNEYLARPGMRETLVRGALEMHRGRPEPHDAVELLHDLIDARRRP